MSKGGPQQKYGDEFKQKVIKTMQREKQSIWEVLRRSEDGEHNAVTRWERIYLTEGSAGLYEEVITGLFYAENCHA